MIKQVPTWYYRQHDADYSLDVPGETYKGWDKVNLEVEDSITAIVVMHTWNTGAREDYPGWKRCVEIFSRSEIICRDLYPDFLKKVRKSNVRLIHVASPQQIYAEYPGYKKTLELVGDLKDTRPSIGYDESIYKLRRFKAENGMPGSHNIEDVRKGQERLDFNEYTRPLDDEYIVSTSAQLFELCKVLNIKHLIYTGFAINMCLVSSPGGFIDMSRRGILCSCIKELVSAVERKESCREQLHKDYALWYWAILAGFVYEKDDIEKYLLS